MIFYRCQTEVLGHAIKPHDWVIGFRKRWTPTKLGRLLGLSAGERLIQYRGNCTVWHRYPNGRRANTLLEGYLCNVWQRLK